MVEAAGVELQFSDESQKKILGHVQLQEERLASLPCELEAGLDTQEIAKLRGNANELFMRRSNQIKLGSQL